MKVKIKEYSGRTGKGSVQNLKGEIVSFSYKQLENKASIPVGKVADFAGGVLRKVGFWKSCAFHIWAFISKERTLWR